MKNVKLSIIIPVYNELNTILEVLRRVQKEQDNKEIIIVDDGSTDGTLDLLRQIEDKNVKIVTNGVNRGKGYAIRRAIEEVSGDITIIQDADLEYYPDEYGILIEKIVQGKADVVFGSRFSGAHRVFYFYHYLGNRILNFLANILLDANLTDLMTGYKAFLTRELKKFVLQAERFGIETEITAEVFRRRLRLYEVPISYDGRGYEEGKKIRWMDFFSCVFWLIRAKLRCNNVGEDTLLKARLMKNNNAWAYHQIRPFLSKKILEIGSGIGTMSKYLLLETRNVVLADIDNDYIKYLKRRFIGNPRAKILEIDICNIDEKLKDEKFDTIVGTNILEHIENDLDLLRKLKSQLNKNGRLLLIVPAHRILYSNFDKKLGHYRRYSQKELSDKLKEAGFTIEKFKFMNFLFAIGWFLDYKIFSGKKISIMTVWLADKLIPLISVIEKIIHFPFGLSLLVVANAEPED